MNGHSICIMNGKIPSSADTCGAAGFEEGKGNCPGGGRGGGLQPLQLLGGREGGPAVFAVAGLPRGGGGGDQRPLQLLGGGPGSLCRCWEGVPL